MLRTMLTGLWAGLFAGLLSLTPTLAAEDHKAEATRHALAAAESAKKGDAAAVGEHIIAAKAQAEAAEKEKANPHLETAIKYLDRAIEHSKKGQIAIAGESAETAATHLKAAEKAF